MSGIEAEAIDVQHSAATAGQAAGSGSLAFRDAGESLQALGRLLLAQGYRFTTVSPATHARVNGRPGNARARSVADVFGWSRPFSSDLLAPTLFGLMETAGILTEIDDGWRSTLRASTLGDHLFFHSAFPTLAADAVFFGPDTYRFADAIAQHLRGLPSSARPRRAVDIGCGAGPGAIAVASAVPAAAVMAVDISEPALALCRVNAELAGLDNLIACRSDLLSGVDGAFDLIVANPPYLLDPLERRYRHGGGALGGGLSLAIVEQALARLAPGGTLLLYTGSAIVDGRDVLQEALADLLRERGVERHHWQYREMDPDVFGEELEMPAYADADRIAAVVLTLTR